MKKEESKRKAFQYFFGPQNEQVVKVELLLFDKLNSPVLFNHWTVLLLCFENNKRFSLEHKWNSTYIISHFPGQVLTQRLFYHNPQIILGRLCLLCSTLNFLNLYGTVPGIVRPATLVSCLPQVSSLIQKGQQQCAAEFFQEFCRVLEHTANQYKSQNLIPANCNLAFLRSFFFELRSEVMCSSCSSVTSTTTMETILPLHITKVWVNVMNNYFFSLYTSDGSPKNKYLSTQKKLVPGRPQ